MTARISALALSTLIGCVYRPPPQVAAQAEQALSWKEYTRRYPDTFIASRDQMQATSAAALSSRGLGAELEAMRAIVSRYLPLKKYTLQATGATPEKLRQQDIEAVAQFLVETGYRSGNVADTSVGAELVRTAARVITGGDEKGDAARIAPTVALAEFVEVVTEPPRSDGLRFSSIHYRILEPLKSSPPAGTIIRVPGGPVHYPDGTTSMSTADLEKARPGHYVLFLSKRKLTTMSEMSGGPLNYASVFGPLRELNGRFVPTGDSAQPEMTFEELKAIVQKQVCLQARLPIDSGGRSVKC